MQSGAERPTGANGNLFRLPIRTARMRRNAAAVFLGVSSRRLTLLNLVGAGPLTESGYYRAEELDRYITEMHRGMGISETEMIRRRHARAADRQSAFQALETHRAPPIIEHDPLMMLATRGELSEKGAFFLFKVMTIFGAIMLLLSITPLIHTHF